MQRFVNIFLATLLFSKVAFIFFFQVVSHDIATNIISDPWHHYHFGLLLVGITLLLRKFTNTGSLTAFGLGIFFEEWLVFLDDLGLNTNSLYHTRFDFVTTVIFITVTYVISKIVSDWLDT